MSVVAFSSPLSLSSVGTVRRARALPSTYVPSRRFASRRAYSISRRTAWTVKAMYEKDGKSDASAEDELLHSELREKVKELFGGRQNVTIDMQKDSDVRFIVHGQGTRTMSPEVQWLRSPRYFLTFIVAVSVVTGAFFTAMYYTGAVHGYDLSDKHHYEMPTYGKDSYIDPYELLQKEQQRQSQYFSQQGRIVQN